MATMTTKLHSITDAAVILGTHRDRIWYAIRHKLWLPKIEVSNTYVLDDDDLVELGKVLQKMAAGNNKKKSGLRYLRDQSDGKKS